LEWPNEKKQKSIWKEIAEFSTLISALFPPFFWGGGSLCEEKIKEISQRREGMVQKF
jgi:hypothetical protein